MANNMADLGNALGKVMSSFAELLLGCPINWGYERLQKDSTLVINTNPYVVKRSREYGEKDLIKLAHEVPYEGCWFYVPSNSDWYNVLKNHIEKINEDGTFEMGAFHAPFRFQRAFKEIINYHTHPKKATDLIVNYFLKQFGGEKSMLSPKLQNLESLLNDPAIKMPTPKETILSIARCYTFLPSTDDMIEYANITKRTQEAGVNFFGKIASSQGILEVEILEPSKEMLKLYENINPRTITPEFVERIKKEKIVEYNPEEKRPDIKFNNWIDSINKEMEGKARFSFSMPQGEYTR